MLRIEKRSHKILAVMVVIGFLAGGGLGLQAMLPARSASTTTEGPGETKKGVPVTLTPARQMAFEQRIVVSGSVAADRYALVSARMPGPLDAVFVDEGDLVEAGKTKLFQTDSLKLTKAVDMARQGLTVAQCSVREKEANLEQLLADEAQAENDLARYEELASHHAIATQIVEQQASRRKQCAAMVKHGRALVSLAEAQLEQARLSLTMADKDLADSLVVAHITGRVSQRFKEPGEMAAAGTPVLRVEDLSTLEVSVFLPEAYYAEVTPGRTKMRVLVGNVDLGEREVSYKSPTVQNKLRTFEVKGRVESPPAGVVPGCLAEVALVTDSRQGTGVPSWAVQIRGSRAVVFGVAEGRAKRIPVKTGREIQGWTEVLDGLAPGTPVLSMGQTLVEEGTPVSIVQEDAP